MIKVEEKPEGITLITLNRPEKRNALSIALMQQLAKAVEAISADSTRRVVILKGEGPIFSAGLDLKEAQDPEKAEHSAHAVAHMLSAVHNCPCVTIAAVQGAALAGGAGLMAACDFVIAEEETLFGFPETRRGMVAAIVMTLLSRQLRDRDLKELLLFGESIDAAKAQQIGLINRVVTKEALVEEALAYASLVLLCAPHATAQTKQLLDTFSARDFSTDTLHAIECHHQMRGSKEAREGIAAFLEKRDPNWVKVLEQ